MCWLMWSDEKQAEAEWYFEDICWKDFPSASARWTEWISQFRLVNKLNSIWLRDEFHSQQCNSRTNFPLHNPSFSNVWHTLSIIDLQIEKVCCEAGERDAFLLFLIAISLLSQRAASPGRVLCPAEHFPFPRGMCRGDGEWPAPIPCSSKPFVLQISLTVAWLCNSYLRLGVF